MQCTTNHSLTVTVVGALLHRMPASALNLEYADLQLLNRFHTVWNYFSTHNGALVIKV